MVSGKLSVNSEVLAEKMETEEDNVSDKEGRQSEEERKVEARLFKLEHLVGEGWSSSSREEVRRQEFVHRENKESHQATYILRPQNGEYFPTEDPLGDGRGEAQGSSTVSEVERLGLLMSLFIQQNSASTRRLLELEEAVSEVQLLGGGEGRKHSQQYLAFMEVVMGMNSCLAEVTEEYVTQQTELENLRREQERTGLLMAKHKKALETHLLSLERSYAHMSDQQSRDFETLEKRTEKMELLVAAFDSREGQRQHLQIEEGSKEEKRGPKWLGRLLKSPCCCCC